MAKEPHEETGGRNDQVEQDGQHDRVHDQAEDEAEEQPGAFGLAKNRRRERGNEQQNERGRDSPPPHWAMMQQREKPDRE